MAATRGMNGVSSKSTLRVKVVGCDGMGELDLIKDMYMSVVIKEVTMSPDGSNVSFVKKKSFLPEWNSTFEADVDSDPLIQLTLRQWSRSVLADLNVSSRMLADKCVNDSVKPISLELKPKGSLRVELQHVTKPKEKPKEAGRKVAVIKRKVAGHTLHPCYSRLGNTCAVCSDKIWGLTKKAFRCKACSLICHKKCVEGLQNTCSGTKKKHGVTPAPNWEWARAIVDIAGAPSTATSQTSQTPSKPTTSCTLDDFVLLKVIGKGAFGKVMLAELRDSGQYFAIKALKKDVVLEGDNLNCTIVERRVLQIGGQHPHLTHLHATFQSKSHLFYVMECLNGGDLMQHIEMSDKFDEERTRFYAAEILCGLQYLHGRGVVYRDLKLENVLLDRKGHAKIADFGMCHENITGQKRTTTFCGTPEYIAPEIIDRKPYNWAVDWWALGVTVFLMLVGEFPYSGEDEDDLYNSIMEDTPEYPGWLSEASMSFIAKLLHRDPERRLGMDEKSPIRADPFFNTINWEQLEAGKVEPPYVPKVRDVTDVSFFGDEYTSEDVHLSPTDDKLLTNLRQDVFKDFDYLEPELEGKLGKH